MVWLQQTWMWLAPAAYSLACEIIAHTPLESNSVWQLIKNGVKAMLPSKPNA
jgi:hypothetical protein